MLPRLPRELVTVRFKPITILIGRNSSGKSSIIKFLLMLQQSGIRSRQFLNPHGDKVQLGDFLGLKNSLTDEEDLRFELSIGAPLVEPRFALASYLRNVGSAESAELIYTVGATISYSGGDSTGRDSYWVSDEKSGKVALRIDRDIGHDSTLLVVDQSLDGEEDEEIDFEGLKPEERDEALERYQLRTFELLLRSSAGQEILRALRLQIDSIRNLPAVRAESAKVILVSHPPSEDVGQRGEHTLPHLQEIIAEDGDRYRFILPHLRNVAGIESVHFNTLSNFVSQVLATNNTTGAKVLIEDFGFGVSQCLPVIVQGAIMQPYNSLLVEQPEAQLHPTAQLEMGSFFADLWNKRRVASVIETHSGNILLRLRRLIARGELSSDDVSVAFFTHDEEKNIPTIRNLDVYEDGSLQPGLPMEFFGADVIEGLNLGARE